jgi:hypothetical protein
MRLEKILFFVCLIMTLKIVLFRKKSITYCDSIDLTASMVYLVSVLASSAIDRGFVGSGQTKVYAIGICCFSAKHTVLRSKSKDWLARKQDNVSEWSDMSTRELLFR